MKKCSFIGLFAGLIVSTGLLFTACNNQTTEDVFYTVKYHTNRSKAPESISRKADSILTAQDLPDLYEEGCTFNGWYDGDTLAKADEYKVTRNVTLEASWKKVRNGEESGDGTIVSYSVIHYLQKLSGVGYVKFNDYTQNLTGKTGENTAAEALVVEGFTAKKINQEIIAADGSTVVKVYYDRNTIIINFDTDGGNEISSISGFYGAKFSAPENPVKDGFEFVGWTPDVPTKFKTNLTLKAKWKNNYVSGIDFSIVQEEISVTCDRTCITAELGYSSYKWIVNQQLQEENGNVIYVPAEVGSYDFSVIATDKFGNLFSSAGTIVVSLQNSNNNFVKVKGSVVSRGGESASGAKDYKYFAYFASGYSQSISDFYICSHEVTQKEFYDVMKYNPSAGKSLPAENEAQSYRPVENISWYEAIAYCNARSKKEGLNPCYKINDETDFHEIIPTTNNSNWNNLNCDTSANGYRLPTEAEWEYVARGGIIGLAKENQKIYSGSDSLTTVGWYKENSDSQTHQVCQKNQNFLGLFDMNGNVSEWCFDIYAKEKGNSGIFGLNRVYRGGSYDATEEKCSINYRYSSAPNVSHSQVGIRLVRSSL